MPIKVWTPGAPKPTAADFNTNLIQQQHVTKAANESVTSSIVIQDDNHLFLTVSANVTYLLESFISYTGATAGDMVYGFSGPTGSVLTYCSDGLGNAAASATDNVSRNLQSLGLFTTSAGCVTGSTCVTLPKGLLQVGSTSGILRLRWAQGTASATATTILAGSVLMLRRMI
jgi:hypothetical protein